MNPQQELWNPTLYLLREEISNILMLDKGGKFAIKKLLTPVTPWTHLHLWAPVQQKHRGECGTCADNHRSPLGNYELGEDFQHYILGCHYPLQVLRVWEGGGRSDCWSGGLVSAAPLQLKNNQITKLINHENLYTNIIHPVKLSIKLSYMAAFQLECNEIMEMIAE